ncbi:unnamed protein product [Prunus armeniaca]
MNHHHLLSPSHPPTPLEPLVSPANYKNLANFDTQFPLLVPVIPATNFFDLGIGLDWRFGDFLVSVISLDTHALLARGYCLGDPLGPKMIAMSS